ncbi:MAG: NifB/NifX family molybdenum-iron cluster-binding protein [Candidatus Nanoarchaeia archaeon]|nr:NifB/NifX family molybdenum-iron cluster-binding protein [Candidatus Nanoarchaeia archaeon]
MKIAISSTGKGLKDNINAEFGRCPYFIIAEINDKKLIKFEAIENINANKPGGAGVSAAQAVAEKGAEAVITGNMGPRALDVLRQFKIPIYKAEGKIDTAVKMFIEGKLKKI